MPATHHRRATPCAPTRAFARTIRTTRSVLMVAMPVLLLHASPVPAREASPGMSAYHSGQFSEAVVHFKRVARQGCKHAQFNLGVMYGNGRGVNQNYKRAAYWYKRSAGQGKASAQFNLAVLYDNGSGVKQSPRRAVKLYRKAARQGHAHAQFNLSQMYRHGEGVRKNPVKAYQWLERAASNNPGRYAFFRDEAWRRLSSEQQLKLTAAK